MSSDLQVVDKSVLDTVTLLLWGPDVSVEVYQRWNQGIWIRKLLCTSYQLWYTLLWISLMHLMVAIVILGFVFGSDEPTALLQHDGGPCAVIVPVQAYILKTLLFGRSPCPENWRQTDGLMLLYLSLRFDLLFHTSVVFLYQSWQ